jgi:hypothetical protein
MRPALGGPEKLTISWRAKDGAGAGREAGQAERSTTKDTKLTKDMIMGGF